MEFTEAFNLLRSNQRDDIERGMSAMEKLRETEYDVNEIDYNIAYAHYRLGDVNSFYESVFLIENDPRSSELIKKFEEYERKTASFRAFNMAGRVATFVLLVSISAFSGIKSHEMS